MATKILTLLLLTACSTPSNWTCDAIASTKEFDSSRLEFRSPGSHLSFELLRMGNKIESFFFLNQHKWTKAPNDPTHVELVVQMGDQKIIEKLALREGAMRLKIPQEIMEKMILSLQDGIPVVILVGGFQETITPELFQERYIKFLRGESLFSNLIKGPVE